MNVIVESLTFTADGYRLAGSLHLPETPRPPVVVGCHGLLSNRGSAKQQHLARACSDRGLAYFRFDHRGCGDSEGDFTRETCLEARCRDLSQAVAALGRYPGLGPVVGLFGSSFGGTVVLAYAAGHRIPAIITYGAPVNSRDIVSRKTDESSAALAQIPSALARSLQFDVSGAIDGIDHVLVVHAQNDEVVPVAHAHRIYALAGDPKRLVIQEGGDHHMSAPAHQQAFLDDVLDWLHERAGVGARR